jgi:hypothetical protein
VCLARLGRAAEAEPMLLQSFQSVRDNPYATRQRQEALAAVVDLYDREHRPEAAASYRRLLRNP